MAFAKLTSDSFSRSTGGEIAVAEVDPAFQLVVVDVDALTLGLTADPLPKIASSREKLK
jgi:hypothetical protein